MSRSIVVDLVDLMNAEKEINLLMNMLEANKRHVRSIDESIGDWKGKSSEELRRKMDRFQNILGDWIEDFKQQQIELVKYTYRMERADRGN